VKECFGEALANQPFEALVNNGCIGESRILNAPLAVAAGGWGQLAGWKAKDEAVYKKMLALAEASFAPLPFHDAHGTCGSPERCRCASCWVKPFEEAYRKRSSTSLDVVRHLVQ
jgi:hypothetical protein